MKKLLASSIILLAPFCVLAQTLTIRIENDMLSVDGTTINKAYINDTSPTKEWPDFTVYTAFASQANLEALSFTTSDATVFLSEIQALATNSIFASEGGWLTAPLASGPIATANDWSLTRTNLDQAATLLPVMLITTSSLGSLSTSDWVGIVYSALKPVPSSPIGSETVNFAAGWDTALVGELGSLTLAPIQAAVPEPAHFALLFGFFGLGVVLWRRRR